MKIEQPTISRAISGLGKQLVAGAAIGITALSMACKQSYEAKEHVMTTLKEDEVSLVSTADSSYQDKIHIAELLLPVEEPKEEITEIVGEVEEDVVVEEKPSSPINEQAPPALAKDEVYKDFMKTGVKIHTSNQSLSELDVKPQSVLIHFVLKDKNGVVADNPIEVNAEIDTLSEVDGKYMVQVSSLDSVFDSLPENATPLNIKRGDTIDLIVKKSTNGIVPTETHNALAEAEGTFEIFYQLEEAKSIIGEITETPSTPPIDQLMERVQALQPREGTIYEEPETMNVEVPVHEDTITWIVEAVDETGQVVSTISSEQVPVSTPLNSGDITPYIELKVNTDNIGNKLTGYVRRELADNLVLNQEEKTIRQQIPVRKADKTITRIVQFVNTRGEVVEEQTDQLTLTSDKPTASFEYVDLSSRFTEKGYKPEKSLARMQVDYSSDEVIHTQITLHDIVTPQEQEQEVTPHETAHETVTEQGLQIEMLETLSESEFQEETVTQPTVTESVVAPIPVESTPVDVQVSESVIETSTPIEIPVQPAPVDVPVSYRDPKQVTKEELVDASWKAIEVLPQSVDDSYYSQFPTIESLIGQDTLSQNLVSVRNAVGGNYTSRLSLTSLPNGVRELNRRYRARMVENINRLRSLVGVAPLDNLGDNNEIEQLIFEHAIASHLAQNHIQSVAKDTILSKLRRGNYLGGFENLAPAWTLTSENGLTVEAVADAWFKAVLEEREFVYSSNWYEYGHLDNLIQAHGTFTGAVAVDSIVNHTRFGITEYNFSIVDVIAP